MVSKVGAPALLRTTHIVQYAIVDGPDKCGHAAKILVACERHDDIPWNSNHVWHLASPCTVHQCL